MGEEAVPCGRALPLSSLRESAGPRRYMVCCHCGTAHDLAGVHWLAEWAGPRSFSTRVEMPLDLTDFAAVDAASKYRHYVETCMRKDDHHPEARSAEQTR